MRWILLLALLVATAGCSRDRAAEAAPPLVPDAITGADPVMLTAPSGARPGRPKTAEAEVVATLISREGPGGHCGVLYVIDSMEFEVRDVLDGSVGGAKRLSIAVGCPEMPPGGAIEHFQIGATYRLRLNQDYPDRVRSPAIDTAQYWLAHIELAR